MRNTPGWLRAGIHSVFAALWIAGTAVFVLKHFFTLTTEFGATLNPWQTNALVVHGVLAVAATFLFGWIAADHVAVMWRAGADRASGLWLLWLVAALIVTGFAGFFLVADSVRAWNGTLHEILGLVLIAPWLVHVAGALRSRRPAPDRRSAQGFPRGNAVARKPEPADPGEQQPYPQRAGQRNVDVRRRKVGDRH
jgi:hypothetical protein